MELNSVTSSAAAMDVPARAYPPVLLFCHPSMEILAKKIVASVAESKGARNYRLVELHNNLQWDSFADGWPNIFIDNVKEIAGRDVILLVSFDSPSVIFEQLAVIYSLPRYLIRSFRIILPYFPTATMERVDREGQIVTAKTLATMLSVVPLAARGPAQIFIFDIHTLQERFYFTDQVIPRLLTAMPLLLTELRALPDSHNVSVAFPDDGAYKRFSSELSCFPTITCIKVRTGAKRVINIKEGVTEGRHVVIVDDLVQTGGTLLECAKAIRAAGATSVSIFITHGVFPAESWKKFINGEVTFENIWITDSIPHCLEIAKQRPFKLLTLSQMIADSLLGYDLVSESQ
ncbi:hypothetical protein EMCRGX_G033234 [Ephydatia muelleri]|eukprot:Em0022g87a